MKKTGTKNHPLPAQKIGFWLLGIGLGLLLVAWLINITFIQPTNFKAQYKQHQYEQCIQLNNSSADCQKNFGSN